MAPDCVTEVDGLFFRLAPAAAPARPITTAATMATGSLIRTPLAGPELGQRSPAGSPAAAAEEEAGGTGGSVSSGFMSVAPVGKWGALLVAQGFDGTEGGSPVGRVDPEEQADDDGHAEGQRNA